jgi:glycosyltransferase involved in cell wall biosynthesis
MKIAFLTPEYPHAITGSSGGIGTSIKNLALGLVNLGHEVIVLVYSQNIDAIFLDKSIQIHQIKNIKLKGLSWFLTRKKIEKIINKLHLENKIDIVETPDWTGITSFIQPKKCPIVLKLHGSDTYFCDLDQRKVHWVNKFHEKRAIQNANGHISVSQFTANKTNELFNLNKKFEVIHNGIITRNFNSEIANNSNSNIILYFGTLIRKKGLLELPFIFNEVIKQNPLAKLYLVGKDASDIVSGNLSTWQMMQALFSLEAIKNVKYFGPVPYSEIKTQIGLAQVCVFPTFAEAFPVSWLEAMAMGKAIVASNIGWAQEVIDHGKNGFLVSPKNHLEYANKIIELLEDKNLNIKMGEEAKIKASNSFDVETIAKQNLAYYQALISISKK